jgi:hypothetical protein
MGHHELRGSRGKMRVQNDRDLEDAALIFGQQGAVRINAKSPYR